MRAVAEECIEWLKEKELYDCFYVLAKASSERHSHYVVVYELSVGEAVSFIKDKDKEICEQKIISKIESLVYYGLFRYKDFDYGKIPNQNYAESIGILDDKYDVELMQYRTAHPIDNSTKIILSEEADVSGQFLIGEIYSDERDKELEQNLADALSPIETEYKKYVDESKSELEKKIADIEGGTIKSIEIISVFTAIIGLFISNILGIANIGEFSLKLFLIINVSTVISIFFLVYFVRLLVKEKNEKKFAWKTFLVLAIFLIISMILIA